MDSWTVSIEWRQVNHSKVGLDNNNQWEMKMSWRVLVLEKREDG
jgi:hypothetical protein